MSMSKRLPALFIPHGGGPCFFMDWTMGPKDTWDNLADWLKHLPELLPEVPKAILVISGHWESPELLITGHTQPPLIYDYYGFPEHTYQLKYPAPGSPELAGQVQSLLAAQNIPAGIDPERGYDHGVFIPFKLAFPDADIPVVQLSLREDLDPAFHLRVGAALEPLRDQGVLIVGSGMSFHNLRAFGRDVSQPSRDFDSWLTSTVTQPDQTERGRQLQAWADAPSGRFSHPREEHLLPLMVVAGAAGSDPGEKVFEDNILTMVLSAFRFG